QPWIKTTLRYYGNNTIATMKQVFFFFSSRRRHTRLQGDWSSDVCSSDLFDGPPPGTRRRAVEAMRRRHLRSAPRSSWALPRAWTRGYVTPAQLAFRPNVADGRHLVLVSRFCDP